VLGRRCRCVTERASAAGFDQILSILREGRLRRPWTAASRGLAAAECIDAGVVLSP
jgi:hypothetical protein